MQHTKNINVHVFARWYNRDVQHTQCPRARLVHLFLFFSTIQMQAPPARGLSDAALQDFHENCVGVYDLLRADTSTSSSSSGGPISNLFRWKRRNSAGVVAELEADWRCTICLSGLSYGLLDDQENRPGIKLARLPCGHSFHENCIGTWLRGHKTCPLCSSDVEDSLRKLTTKTTRTTTAEFTG